MTEFGSNLRQARERRGISLRQIATSTKISIVALEALERDDFSHLPGGIFSRAFVRAYAVEVGIDPEESVQQFLVRLGEVEAARGDTEVPVEVSEDDRAFLERQRKAASWLRIGAIVLVIIVLAAFSAWRLSGRAKSTAQIEPLPTSAPDVSAPSTAAPAPVANAPVVTAPASQTDAVTPGPATAAAIVVHLEASASCWTEVTVDGQTAMKETLTAGSQRNFSGDREVVLMAGNAGVLSWTLNGKAAKPIGKVGEVQTVRVTRDSIESFLR